MGYMNMLGVGSVGLWWCLGGAGCVMEDPAEGDMGELAELEQEDAVAEPVLTGGRRIAHPDRGEYGSLGLMVRDSWSGQPMLLSTATVMSGLEAAPIKYDFVDNADTKNLLGFVERSVFTPSAFVFRDDFAVAFMAPGGSSANIEDGKILGIGAIAGVGEPTLGATVKFWDINDNAVRLCKITEIVGNYFQLASTHPAETCVRYGNFGSVLVDTATNRAVGLLHAISIANQTYATRLSYVFAKLGVQYVDPDVSSVPFYRYRTPTGTHFYSAHWSDVRGPWEGKIYEGVMGSLYRYPKSGTVALHRFYNGAKNDYLYLNSWVPGTVPESGYTYQGITGYVFPTQVPGTVPLYRMRRISDLANFYTIHTSELSTPGHILVGNAGYIHPGL